MHHYRAFNLTISSQLNLPELCALPHQPELPPDVRIQWGAVAAVGLDSPLVTDLEFQANEKSLWLNIPKVARYLISDGNQITIEPYAQSDEDSIRLFLLGSSMGALLMQRNVFLLHANAIKIGNQCISFAGASGIGKSTLAAAFLQKGYSILTDDVCAIDSKGDVLPGFPHIKLWADASRHMAIETQSLRKIRPTLDKFSVPAGTQFYGSPLPLKVVYILDAHNHNSFKFTQLNSSQKFNPLKNNTYRGQYLKGLCRVQSHFKQCGMIASQVEVVHITRPNRGFQLNALIERILTDLHTRGISHFGYKQLA
jgi:hypothetical protein